MTDADRETLICFTFASLISADNEHYAEETKQELIRRYHEHPEKDWDYILNPLGEDKYKYLKLFTK